MRKLIMLLFVLALGVNMTAFATNETDKGGNKNEGAKVELTNAQVNPVIVDSIVIPDFNLNSEVVSLKTVLPACSGDTYQSGDGNTPPPAGYTYEGVRYTTFGYDLIYSKSCTETITIYWPWGAETYTYTSSDVHTIHWSAVE